MAAMLKPSTRFRETAHEMELALRRAHLAARLLKNPMLVYLLSMALLVVNDEETPPK
ncbi:MAG: hypothetical protein KJZ83_06905 [Burkholderiaceae bacterium]|nr:hypothetical protein [Burkholderiaceae bacterium]